MILERRIIAGLIVSDDYLRRIASFWSDDLIEAPEFKRIARWCLDYWGKYERAPDRDIEQVYLTAIREEAIPKAEAELIEGILTGVSDDYGRGEQFNAAYLYDETVKFFRERELEQHNEAVADLRERGRLDEAEALASSWTPRSWATTRGLDLGTEPGYERLRGAFSKATTPLFTYPGALGELLNRHLVRDGFVAFMGPEKRGKTFWLTDIAFRALRGDPALGRPGCNVAFFQAGDMTESQYLRRLAVHVAGRSDDPAYCRPRWRPVGDCAFNQFDDCDRPDRNGPRDGHPFGIYEPDDFAQFKEDEESFQRFDDASEDRLGLASLAKRNAGYCPCDSFACDRRRPVVWLERVEEVPPLTADHAVNHVRRFFEKHKRRFRLATYPSGTLTCNEMRSCLDEWEAQDDFVPDVIVVDYSDIMAAVEREFRHRQNEVWMGLRAISQERHALVATATQTDADSYKSALLKLSNFSEDKRKFGHVTAMWGLNQDPRGREKDLGIMRLNTLLVREGAFNSTDVVTVLQDLAGGRPFTESFWPRPPRGAHSREEGSP